MSDLQNILNEKSKAYIIICLKSNIFKKAERKNKLRYLVSTELLREKGRENRQKLRLLSISLVLWGWLWRHETIIYDYNTKLHFRNY